MIDAPTHLENGMFRRRVSVDGKNEIGIHPVLFGFRIRAGIVGDYGVKIDYCCQADPKLIQLVYNCVQAIMKTRVASGEPVFKDFPVPENKLYNDLHAITELVKMMIACDKSDAITVTSEELQSYREEMFQNLGIQG